MGTWIRETKDGIFGLVNKETLSLINELPVSIKEIKIKKKVNKSGWNRVTMINNVRYRPTDTTEWRTMKIVSRKITEATVNNLNPGREYEFMVLSQDKHGDGMFSKTLRIFTQPRMFSI